MEYQTIAVMFFDITGRYPDRGLFFEKIGGEWQGYTGNEVRSAVRELASGLTALGIKKGEHIGIVSENCPRWAFSDYACAVSGLVSVAIYPTLIAAQIQYIADHSEVRLVFAENKRQVQKLVEIKKECPHLQTIVCFDDSAEFTEDYIISFGSVLKLGQAYIEKNPELDWSARSAEIKPDDLHTLIYTSGTTAEPKGVMLTNRNLMSNVEGCQIANPTDENDIFLSVLPLSHVFERTGEYYAMVRGGRIYYAEDIARMVKNLEEIQPTIMFAVPRLFEKMYTRITAKLASGSSIKRKIADWAIAVGEETSRCRKAGRIGAIQSLKNTVADRLVFSKIKVLFGKRFKWFICGGAPLSPEIGKFFDALGVIILEGYGLTEASPVITGNHWNNNHYGTVGPVLENVEIKFAADNEILARGPSIMQGYYKDKPATLEAIDDDGWLYTGDIGEMDADGMLRITDRKKNIIVTAGGKNVVPLALESALTMDEYIEQVVVVGDRRKFISALIVPSFEQLTAWARKLEISFSEYEDLIKNSEVIAHFKEIVNKKMESFARFEQIKKFVLLHQPFTIEDGTLTPKLSIKRKVVETRYADLIEALYTV